LSVFNAHSVKYLVVDGYAVSFHAQPRATKDLDLFIQADPENAKATYAALASFGAPLTDITVDDLADPQKFIRFGREPVAVDILPSIDGVNFEEAWARRVDAGRGQSILRIQTKWWSKVVSGPRSNPALLRVRAVVPLVLS
jgi:hypothetical protein